MLFYLRTIFFSHCISSSELRYKILNFCHYGGAGGGCGGLNGKISTFLIQTYYNGNTMPGGGRVITYTLKNVWYFNSKVFNGGGCRSQSPHLSPWGLRKGEVWGYPERKTRSSLLCGAVSLIFPSFLPFPCSKDVKFVYFCNYLSFPYSSFSYLFFPCISYLILPPNLLKDCNCI